MNQSDLIDDKIQQGFSSQQEFKAEQIIYTETVKQKIQSPQKESIRFKIPPPQEIKDKKYSLRPDIAMGWAPKIQLPSPVPIIFECSRYDNIIKRLLKKPLPKAKIIYLGPRYENTYFSWYKKPFSFPYSHMKSPHNIKFTDRQFCGQHWQAEKDINFDSMFQSANLDSVVKVGQRQYDLFMRVDSNTRGHLQWFNFKIRNMQKDQDYQFNICNFQKGKILYGRGSKPYVFSTQKHLRQKIGWQQRGQNMTFQKKISKTYRALEIQYFFFHKKRSSKYFKLSFTLSTSYDNDVLQVAYCVPYTYSQMSEYLHKKTKELQKSNRDILKMSKLCTTLGGLQLPLLIIHENHKQKTQSTATDDDDLPIMKRCVIICGRAHPGESNGSYMIEGFLDFICGESKMAQFLRKHVIFKIVPMMNPDGVALGNYRTGLSGKDFNREYKDPDKEVFPQVYAFKKLVTQNKLIFKQNLSIFLDFHGHSVKKNTFAYGPQFPIVNKFYYESRILPKLLANLTPMFRYYSCSFKVSECKNTTARAILLRKLEIPLSFTIETSNGFYFDYEKLKDIPYTDSKWKLMGQKVGHALSGYMELVVKSDILRSEKLKAKKIIEKEIFKRRTFRSVSNSKNNSILLKKNDSLSPQKQQSGVVLQGIEDEGIQMLFQEIRKAEEEKQRILQVNKCSDDQLSEGSSDGQAETDDLSAKQFTKLFNCIKHKKYKNVDKCKFSPMKRTRTNETINQNDQIKSEKLNQLHTSGPSHQIITKFRIHKNDPKKDFLLNLMQHKKRSSTPKVVNFSFGLHHTPQKKTPQKNTVHPSKITFFDASNNHFQQKAWNDANHRFHEMVHKKIFHSGTKQAKSRQKQGGSARTNIFSTTTYVSVQKQIANHLKDQTLRFIPQVPIAFQTPNRRNIRFQTNRNKKVFVQNIDHY